MLRVQNLEKTYRSRTGSNVYALRGVTLSIPAQSFTLLTGPSGSGKTTLLAILGALELPTRGQVIFAGQDLSRCSGVELARIRRRVGFVFQDFALIPGLPVWENITYSLIPRGVARSDRYRQATKLLAAVGMSDRAMARPRELSGGEQQRIAIARALAGDPELLLADEPTSNLDAKTSQIAIELLSEAHSQGRTIIVSSHDGALAGLATQVCEMELGQVKAVTQSPKSN